MRRFWNAKGVSSRALAVGITASLATVASGPAHAQDADNEGNTEIVVTAQFREQNLQDTPIAITAQTGEMLAERGITTTTQLVAVAPNVNLTANAAVFGVSASVFIRGIGQYDNNFAYEPGVGIYLDDIYYGVITGADFALADIDRVEILRGPQGTLSGKNSLGGALKLYNRKPSGDGSGYMEATYGRFNRIDVKGAYDLGLIDDQLAMRVSGFSNSKDGYMTRLDFACANPSEAGNIPRIGSGPDCVIGRDGGVSNWGLRGALRFTPTTDIEVNIAVDRTVDKSTPAAAGLFYAFAPFGAATYDGDPAGTPWDTRFIPDDPYTSYATYRDTTTGFSPGGQTHIESWGISGDIDWGIGENLSIRSITGYRELDTQAGFDQDGSPIGVATTLIDNRYNQFTQELRLSGTADIADWTVGGFYYDARGWINNTINSGPTQFITDDPVDTTSKSVFGHIVLHPMENFNITAGIRYTDDEKTYVFTRYNLQGGPANPGQAPLNTLPPQTYAGDRVDYRIGADYRFSPEVMVYGQFSTGYKGGGVNAKPFTAGQAIDFGPETLDAWEVGLKTDLADNRVRLNVAGFYMKYKDIQLVNAAGLCINGETPENTPSCVLSAAPFNAGDADIKGVEFEADLQPTEGLSITGTVSYLDFEYQRLDPLAVASRISLDDYPPLTPKWKASGGIAYAADLGGNAGTITPRFDIEYQSETYSDPANNGFYPGGFFPTPAEFADLNPFLIPGRTTMNARLIYDSPDRDWQISAAVKNLTNEFYWTNSFAFYFSGTGQRIIAPPREWSVTIRRNF